MISWVCFPVLETGGWVAAEVLSPTVGAVVAAWVGEAGVALLAAAHPDTIKETTINIAAMKYAFAFIFLLLLLNGLIN
jgi:hypothetical protein